MSLLLLLLSFLFNITEICPTTPIQPHPAKFTPDGIILTAFDSTAIWVYNIGNNSRYPLPDTAPCSDNCHLSPDARWITYFDANTGIFHKMRLNGTQRTPLARDASDVAWWSEDTLIVWSLNQSAYLRLDGTTEQRMLNSYGITHIQPGGSMGLHIQQTGEEFLRHLVNMDARGLDWSTTDHIALGLDKSYYNAASWSSNGEIFAFVAPVTGENIDLSSELFILRSGESTPIQLTNLTDTYGTVRINGHDPGDLSWSPDNQRVAFWVISQTEAAQGVLHVIDVETSELTRYCGFSTEEFTPNPPHLAWSPDGTHIAFAGNIPGDNKGYFLFALNIETGVFTTLSEGVFPISGRADVIAWGLEP